MNFRLMSVDCCASFQMRDLGLVCECVSRCANCYDVWLERVTSDTCLSTAVLFINGGINEFQSCLILTIENWCCSWLKY